MAKNNDQFRQNGLVMFFHKNVALWDALHLRQPLKRTSRWTRTHCRTEKNSVRQLLTKQSEIPHAFVKIILPFQNVASIRFHLLMIAGVGTIGVTQRLLQGVHIKYLSWMCASTTCKILNDSEGSCL